MVRSVQYRRTFSDAAAFLVARPTFARFGDDLLQLGDCPAGGFCDFACFGNGLLGGGGSVVPVSGGLAGKPHGDQGGGHQDHGGDGGEQGPERSG